MICQEKIEKENPYFCYRCQKLFHNKCLYKWDKEKETQTLICPCCKNELNINKWRKKLDYDIDLKLINELKYKYDNEKIYKNNIFGLHKIIEIY